MDMDRDKRSFEEVLFRWDPRSHSVNFNSLSEADDVFIKRRLKERGNVEKSHEFLNKLEDKESDELDKLFKESTTEGLNMNPDVLTKNRDKRAELLKNLKKYQLHSCKDWLGSNTVKSCIAKVDTLDRLSSIILNPEFPMRHEAVLYSMQLGKSDFEFYNALFMTKLSRMSNPGVLELVRHPLFIRNRMLLLTERKKCECALRGLTKPQPHQRNFLPTRRPFMDSQQVDPSVQSSQFTQAKFGDALLNKLMMPQGGMSGGFFGSERNYANVFGLEKKQEAEKRPDNVDESDIVCPFHCATDLPEVLKSPKGISGVVSQYNLFYKYDEVKAGSRSFHIMSLYPLTDPVNSLSHGLNLVKDGAHSVKDIKESNRVYQYRLNSKLLALNYVYLRDFEYERYYSYNNFYNGGHNTQFGSERGMRLANFYTGDALFIVTKTEFIIALLKFDKESMRMGVLLRDKNYGNNFKDVLYHKETGRIFMLSTNNLLYEYQYQLGFGPKSLSDYKLFNYLHNSLQYTKQFLSKLVRSNRVYDVKSNEGELKLDFRTPEVGSEGERDYWSVNNCLDNLDSPVNKATCYYPPLLWSELQYGSPSNIFNTASEQSANPLNPGVSCCRCGFGCKMNSVEGSVKCINPWNKAFMKSDESLAVVDQDRWLVSLLNLTSGDLSVFYLHPYTSVDDFEKACAENERLFPYDLTLFNLKYSSMTSSLERLGYNRYSHGSKLVKILPAPLNFVQGVDLILVDNLGVKIFVGFANTTLTAPNSLISQSLTSNLSNDSVKISAVTGKTGSTGGKVGLCVKGFRMPMRHMTTSSRGPFSLFRSKPNVTTFILKDLFFSLEPVRKLHNGNLARVILSVNDSSSFFQNYPSLSLSLSEEFYQFNENTVQFKNLEENQPVEYYHEFYLKLDEQEKVITLHRTEKEVFILTTEKVYKFRTLDVDFVLKSLVKYPKNALAIIKPPPTTTAPHVTESKCDDLNVVKSKCDEFDVDVKWDGEGSTTNNNYFIKSLEQGIESVEHSKGSSEDDLDKYIKCWKKDSDEVFANIFGDDLVEVCQDSNQIIGYCLHYLSWLYGPENLFKFIFSHLTSIDHGLDLTFDILYRFLFSHSSDDYNVFLSSFGIPYKVFNYSIPGCYSVLNHKFQKPVISPWCKFVSFSHNNKVKQSKVTTNTSPLVDGILLYTSQLLSPLYCNRVFDLVPNFYNNTITDVNTYRDFGKELNRFEGLNEFVVGTRVDLYLTMELAMGYDEANVTLQKLNSLSKLVGELVTSYERCNLDHIILLLTTLGSNVIKMLLPPETTQVEPFPFHTSNVQYTVNYKAEDVVEKLKLVVKEKFENDLRSLRELMTVLQVSQEFLASAMLLHTNTVLGECEYDFDKNLHLLNLIPSKTPNPFFSPQDYVNIHNFVNPFKCKFTQESPKSKLILTKSILNTISQVNLLNLFDEIENMNKCNKVKYLERQVENTGDFSKSEYIHS